MIDETIKDILSRRENTHPEDSYRIEKLWEEEIEALSFNVEETIDFIKSRCTANEFIWLSEVFEEVAEKTQSIEFVNCLYDVAKKYPSETKEYIQDRNKSMQDGNLYEFLNNSIKNKTYIKITPPMFFYGEN